MARRIAWLMAATLLATLTALALVEVGLRVGGWWMLRQRNQPLEQPGQVTILCVGDSWTFGVESGDPARLSYPAQLQRLLDRAHGRGRYRVINEGRPGEIPGTLIPRLPGLLDRNRPQIVLALTGGVIWVREDETRDLKATREPFQAAGWLGSLRVVRLLSVFRAPPRFDMSLELERRDLSIRAAMHSEVSASDPRSDSLGITPIPDLGCKDWPAKRQLYRRLRQAERFDDSLLQQITRQEPRCLSAWVTWAEICLRHRRHKCATAASDRALEIFYGEPHSMIIRALQLRRRVGQWSQESWRLLQYVRMQHPRFLRARRLWFRAALKINMDLCAIQAELEDVLRTYPRCRWARRARTALGGIFSAPLWRELERLNGLGLDNLERIARQRRLRLLLLDYPDSQVNPCLSRTARAIRRFASERGIPHVELGPALGPVTRDRSTGNFGVGQHPNARGYSLMARAVLERLEQLGWVSGRDRE